MGVAFQDPTPLGEVAVRWTDGGGADARRLSHAGTPSVSDSRCHLPQRGRIG